MDFFLVFVLLLLGYKSSLHVKEINIIKRDFQKFFQQLNCLGSDSACSTMNGNVLWDNPVPLIPELPLAQLVLWMPYLPSSTPCIHGRHHPHRLQHNVQEKLHLAHGSYSDYSGIKSHVIALLQIS